MQKGLLFRGLEEKFLFAVIYISLILNIKTYIPSGELGEIVQAPYREPSIDLIESDKEVIATAEMPGLEKQEEKGYIYRERRSGSYYRAASLPSAVDPDKSKATYRGTINSFTNSHI